MNKKRFFDPLYGPVELDDFEYSLIFLPEVQRLRYVRMCNINSLLVTGASEISRFEHILGVMRLAKEWVKFNSDSMTEHQKKSFIAAAILHDFQTGPFGHSLQYILEENETDEQFKHDDLEHGVDNNYHQLTDAAASFAGKVFESSKLLGDYWQEITELIHGSGSLGPLISGTLDIDNIDNVIRLAYHVGVADKADATIALNLSRDLKCESRSITISTQSLPLVERWQEIRRRLYQLLLLDWAEFSAKAMLTKSIELLIVRNKLGPDVWKMTDLEFLSHLQDISVGEAQDAKELARRISCGDLYHPVLLAEFPGTSKYDDLNNPLEKRKLESRIKILIKSKLSLSKEVIVHYIKDKGKTDRAVPVIIRDSNRKVTLGMNSDKTLIGIFISSEENCENKDQAKDLIKLFLEDDLKITLNYFDDPIAKVDESIQLELL
jgi:HD superfamily phosphohydrolase